MAQLTRLGLYGGSRGVYTFTDKSSPHPVGHLTRLGLYGGPRGVYSFTDKSILHVGRVTALSPWGGPGRVYDFIGKKPKPPIEPPRRGKLHGFNRMRLLQYGGRFKS